MHFTFVVYSTSTFSPSLGTVAELLPPHTIGTNCGHLSFALRVVHSCVIHEQSAQMITNVLFFFLIFLLLLCLLLLFVLAFLFFLFLLFLFLVFLAILDLPSTGTTLTSNTASQRRSCSQRLLGCESYISGIMFSGCLRHLGVFGLLFLLLGVFGHLLTICCSCQLHSPSSDKRNGN